MYPINIPKNRCRYDKQPISGKPVLPVFLIKGTGNVPSTVSPDGAYYPRPGTIFPMPSTLPASSHPSAAQRPVPFSSTPVTLFVELHPSKSDPKFFPYFLF